MAILQRNIYGELPEGLEFYRVPKMTIRIRDNREPAQRVVVGQSISELTKLDPQRQDQLVHNFIKIYAYILKELVEKAISELPDTRIPECGLSRTITKPTLTSFCLGEPLEDTYSRPNRMEIDERHVWVWRRRLCAYDSRQPYIRIQRACSRSNPVGVPNLLQRGHYV
jgi:predicted DNA-binding protein